MARVECGHGHFYDSDIYPSCPYCSNGGNMWVDLGGMNSVGDPGRTAPIGGGSPVGFDAGRTAPIGGGFAPGMGGGMGMMGDVNKTMPINGGVFQPGQSVGEMGSTMPPSGYRSSTDEQKTVAMMQKNMKVLPVAGWLVCIKGEEKGKDYRIAAKINTVGRSDKMDICIKGDNTISKENHMRIAYEDKHNTFTVIPGESTNNIYINDQPIYVPTKLAAFDNIELGETRLLFVPLCSESFRWSDTAGASEE